MRLTAVYGKGFPGEGEGQDERLPAHMGFRKSRMESVLRWLSCSEKARKEGSVLLFRQVSNPQEAGW